VHRLTPISRAELSSQIVGALAYGLRTSQPKEWTEMTDVAASARHDQEMRDFAEKIRKYGWAIQGVGGDRCACCPGGIARERSKLFAYTIGMFGIAHPEFLIFPKRLEDAQRALNAIAHRVHCHGEQFIPGQVVDFDGWRHRATVEEVPNPGEIVFTANRFYQRPNEASVPVLQLTLNDMSGKFPWDEGCSWTARQQPRPGKFKA
jgi:uncharacterized protein DUF4262